MIEPGDRELLKTTADTLSRASLRIKAGGAARPRAKASAPEYRARVQRPEPDYLALSHAQDAEQMSFGGPFDRTEFEDVERTRAENANAVLRERKRKDELERRRQVSPEPETPWWR
jgi:hypothetical protein